MYGKSLFSYLSTYRKVISLLIPIQKSNEQRDLIHIMLALQQQQRNVKAAALMKRHLMFF